MYIKCNEHTLRLSSIMYEYFFQMHVSPPPKADETGIHDTQNIYSMVVSITGMYWVTLKF